MLSLSSRARSTGSASCGQHLGGLGALKCGAEVAQTPQGGGAAGLHAGALLGTRAGESRRAQASFSAVNAAAT